MIEATNELYLASKRTIEKACFNAWRKNPIIQLDDYRSYADEIFMDSTRSFDESKRVKFNSWLTTQLLRLIPYPRDFKMTTCSNQESSSLVLSLDEPSELLDGKPCTLHDVRHPVNDSYAKTLSEPSWVPEWVERLQTFKPYLGEMTEDAKVMVGDIIDGDTMKKDEHGVPVPEHGRKWFAKLTPRQLYCRLYRQRGWSFERVRAARIEVETVLVKSSPTLQKLCSLPESNGQVQEELF